ncbi:MAG TPA: tetraacyldisaccharide 4'-kinase [Xanthobacteraceae bacterium]|jgi:tetraacyldisaccharide 4'-kinase|nr:tetraacyldisaccharide 4'-kinase [Xanthobacteraceae bacterium]
MHEPAFWWQPSSLRATLLSPFAAIYGAIAARRMRRRGARATVPVICIGNLTLGGSGKTPTALFVGHLFKQAGLNPFVLSRGYGGREKGPLRVDPVSHGGGDVGDEPLLLARHLPVIVTADRVAGATLAGEQGADIIIMDDGFQNPSLQKDFSLVVVDARRGIGNGKVFPAGPLRAPIETQLNCAAALLVIGEGHAADTVAAMAAARGLPVFTARLETEPNATRALQGRRVLAFAGIADPEKFFASTRAAGIAIAAQRAFPDHHVYRAADAEALFAQAEAENLIPLTTEKDMARMQGDEEVAFLAKASQVLPVTLAVTQREALRALLFAVLARD